MFRALNEKQKEVVKACKCKKDVLVVMPTGGGKSAYYFDPGLLGKGVTLVISPLHTSTLNKDQKRFLKSKGVCLFLISLGNVILISIQIKLFFIRLQQAAISCCEQLS